MEKRIILLTPVYNEEGYIEQAIESVIKQSIKPFLWLIINDNSTDNSVKIIQHYEEKYPWIKLLHGNKKSDLNYGPKIVSVRTVGYNYVIDNNIEYDFLAHLDADIILCDSYFKDILDAFATDSRLGICGGKLCLEDGVVENTRTIYIRDANRVIRKECILKFGYQQSMWLHDSSDKMQALYYGWNVYGINNISIHLRPTGKKIRLNHCYNIGLDTNRFGYNFLSTFFKSTKFLKRTPFLLAYLSFWFGYIKGYNKSKFYSKEFNHFLNQFYLSDMKSKLIKKGSR